MPFSDRKEKFQVPQVQVGDLGFGYINEKRESVAMPASPRSPLKSAMRFPGSPRTINGNPLSPTFREETILERREELTEKEQARDLVGPTSRWCSGDYGSRLCANKLNRKSRQEYGWLSLPFVV
jgi:hypothetical protein